MTAWVVVPCTGTRSAELRNILDSIDCTAERVVVVTTDPDPVTSDDADGYPVHILHSEHRLHFGMWHNLAFDYIEHRAEGVTEVLCIGSSVRPGSIVEPLRSVLRTREPALTMVGPDLHGHVQSGWIAELGPERTVHNRIPGVCFMVPLELGLRFDPQFRWWYSDDDLEMQARQLGPVAVVGGLPVTYDPVHPLTAEQAVWASEDQDRFYLKWGKAPH